MIDYRYSTEQLLMYALNMLDHAAKEQATSRREDNWLSNNDTLAVIRERVEELKQSIYEQHRAA